MRSKNQIVMMIIPERSSSLKRSSTALPRKNRGSTKDEIKATGANTQTKDPTFSSTGADTNLLSSTDWWVSPRKETEPGLPRNGSDPSIAFTCASLGSLLGDVDVRGCSELRAHSAVLLLNLDFTEGIPKKKRVKWKKNFSLHYNQSFRITANWNKIYKKF